MGCNKILIIGLLDNMKVHILLYTVKGKDNVTSYIINSTIPGQANVDYDLISFTKYMHVM